MNYWSGLTSRSKDNNGITSIIFIYFFYDRKSKLLTLDQTLKTDSKPYSDWAINCYCLKVHHITAAVCDHDNLQMSVPRLWGWGLQRPTRVLAAREPSAATWLCMLLAPGLTRDPTNWLLSCIHPVHNRIHVWTQSDTSTRHMFVHAWFPTCAQSRL